MRTVNCAINNTERRKPLMATSVTEDVAGGSTAIAAARLTTTKRSASAARASPRLASAATPAEGAGAGPSKRPKNKKDAGGKGSSSSRLRLDNDQKLEILKLMDAKVSYAQIADRFGCSVRFLATVRSDRKQIEAAAAAGGGSQKTARKGDFPEVSYINTLLAGTPVSIGGEQEDEQQKGSGDENTHGARAPCPIGL